MKKMWENVQKTLNGILKHKFWIYENSLMTNENLMKNENLMRKMINCERRKNVEREREKKLNVRNQEWKWSLFQNEVKIPNDP